MTLYELTKKYGSGKGEDTMWRMVKRMSDYLDENLDAEKYDKLLRDMYGEMSGGHYNEEYAKEDVEKMYYVGIDDKKYHAPYWSKSQTDAVYESVKRSIPSDYNCNDFYVALNMIKSDNCVLYRKWFRELSDADFDTKLVETTVNWLNDEDNPYGRSKVWKYINGK